MLKNSILIALVITGFGALVCFAGNGLPIAKGPSAPPNGETETAARNVQVVLGCDKAKVSMEESLDIEAIIWNNGPEPLYLFRRMEWGDGGGLAFYLRDSKGKLVGNWNDSLLPPPPRDDPAMFVLLDPARSYGVRSHVKANRLVPGPGKYTLQVGYQCPFSKNLYDGKLRSLNALWVEDPKLASNIVALEAVP